MNGKQKGTRLGAGKWKPTRTSGTQVSALKQNVSDENSFTLIGTHQAWILWVWPEREVQVI